MSKKQSFVVKYILPNGEMAGYHCDSFCTIGVNKKSAKIYANYDSQQAINKQLDVIRKIFASVWDWNPGDQLKEKDIYKNLSVWKGSKLEEIKIVAEVI